jgi:hypothetical protein
MALKKSFETAEGLTANEAYFRVENVSIVKNQPATIAVNIFASAENTKKPVQVNCYGFEYSLDGENVIKQAYTHLKTLPEFAGATDC